VKSEGETILTIREGMIERRGVGNTELTDGELLSMLLGASKGLERNPLGRGVSSEPELPLGGEGGVKDDINSLEEGKED
jgi:hypothetical protein